MKNRTFWDRAADKYAQDPIADMEGYVQTRDLILGLLQPSHRVFELGCGTGATAFELASGVQSYCATDVSTRMIEIAKDKRAPDTPAHLSFETGDVHLLGNGTHDVVLALNVLHLLPDLPAVLLHIFDALPSGGMLISKTSLLRDGAWFIPAMIPVMRLFGKAPYVRSMRATEIIQELKNAGFEISQDLRQDGMVPRLFIVAHKR